MAINSKYITSLRIKENGKSGIILIRLINGELCEFPIYDLGFIPPLHCAKYARIVANEVFGRRYGMQKEHQVPAWDLHLIYKTISVRNFYTQFRDGEIEKGDLVGIFNPKSDYNGCFDRDGKSLRYTHVGVVLGELPNRRIVLGEQRNSQRRVISLNELDKIHNVPIEVIKDITKKADN